MSWRLFNGVVENFKTPRFHYVFYFITNISNDVARKHCDRY